MLSAYRSKVMALSRSSMNCLPKSLTKPQGSTTTQLSSRSGSSGSSSSITSFPQKNPFAFQLIVATGKTSAADLVAQVVAEGKIFDEIDWKRNGIFVVFGFAYLGGFQWWLMVTKYRQWFPTMDSFAKLTFAQKLKDKAGLIDAAKMVVFDLANDLFPHILYSPPTQTAFIKSPHPSPPPKPQQPPSPHSMPPFTKNSTPP